MSRFYPRREQILLSFVAPWGLPRCEGARRVVRTLLVSEPMKRTTKKLALTRHSVRVLTQHELHTAHGGVQNTFQTTCGRPTASGNQSGCDSTGTITTIKISELCGSAFCTGTVYNPG